MVSQQREVLSRIDVRQRWRLPHWVQSYSDVGCEVQGDTSECSQEQLFCFLAVDVPLPGIIQLAGGVDSQIFVTPNMDRKRGKY